MAAHLNCSNCGHQQSLTDFYAGKSVACPQCEATVQVQSSHKIYRIAQAPTQVRSSSTTRDLTPVPLKEAFGENHPGAASARRARSSVDSSAMAPTGVNADKAREAYERVASVSVSTAGADQFNSIFESTREHVHGNRGGYLTSLILIGMGAASILVAQVPTFGGLFALATASLGFFAVLSRGCGGRSTFPGWFALIGAMLAIFTAKAPCDNTCGIHKVVNNARETTLEHLGVDLPTYESGEASYNAYSQSNCQRAFVIDGKCEERGNCEFKTEREPKTSVGTILQEYPETVNRSGTEECLKIREEQSEAGATNAK